MVSLKRDWSIPIREWRLIIGAFVPLFRQHRRSLLYGFLASLGVVAARAGLPWVFKLLLNPLTKGSAEPDLSTPLLLAGLTVFVILLAWGYFDQLLRWQFARFSIGVTRLAQLKAAESLESSVHYSRLKGDLASRLLGDASRFRSGLKSFLVLVLVNAILLLVSCAALVMVDFEVGLVMSAASLAIFGVTLFSAATLYKIAIRKRKKQGKFVERLNQRAIGEPIDEFDFQPHDTDESEATSTKIQGRATWVAYTIFGLASVGALVLAVQHLHERSLHQSDMVVLMLYLFNIRAPIIRLTRQGCKSGQVLACGKRLQKLFSREAEPLSEIKPLRDQLIIEELKIRSRADSPRKYALKIQNMVVPAHSSLALVGGSGSGKSLFLKALSGQVSPSKALLFIDGSAFDETALLAISDATYYLPQNPSWSRQPLSQVIGTDSLPLENKPIRSALSACGFKRLLRDLPEGLASEVSSDELSFSQRRAVALAQAVLTKDEIVLLDSPELGLKASSIPRFLKAITRVHADRTLIVCLTDTTCLSLFDRVLELKNGKTRFDGPAREWHAKEQVTLEARSARRDERKGSSTTSQP